MAHFPIRGMATLTFLKDFLGPIFESESLERWLKLGDKAFAINPRKSRLGRRQAVTAFAHRSRVPRGARRKPSVAVGGAMNRSDGPSHHPHCP
jgi:hypothetical protein